jgi:hypothetical protein
LLLAQDLKLRGRQTAILQSAQLLQSVLQGVLQQVGRLQLSYG